MSFLIDRYKCNLCGTEWEHKWDDDPNNDYTICPECNEIDFEEVAKQSIIDPVESLKIHICAANVRL